VGANEYKNKEPAAELVTLVLRWGNRVLSDYLKASSTLQHSRWATIKYILELISAEPA